MKIKMTTTMKGSANHMGNVSMEYSAGQTYDMQQPWQESLAHVFVENNFATEVGGKKKAKVDAPTETKRARNEDGTMKADDPATPDVDEAWEDGKAPKKKSRKKS